jgi:hypothetical protein
LTPTPRCLPFFTPCLKTARSHLRCNLLSGLCSGSGLLIPLLFAFSGLWVSDFVPPSRAPPCVSSESLLSAPFSSPPLSSPPESCVLLCSFVSDFLSSLLYVRTASLVYTCSSCI